MDGSEIHYSTSRSSTFQYSWSARGNHVIKVNKFPFYGSFFVFSTHYISVMNYLTLLNQLHCLCLKVVAHAAPPVSPTPGFKQYDLYIDGQSFFTMPKAYELGLRGPVSAYDRVPGTSYGSPAAAPSHGYGSYNGSGIQAPSTRQEEDRALQEAINASLEESQKYLASKGNAPESSTAAAPATQAADLMDLGGPRTAPDSQSITTYNAHQYGAPPAQYGSPPPQYSSPLPQYGAQQSQYTQYPPQSRAISYQQPGPGYGGPSQQNYQTAQPSSSTALVPSNAPSQPYAIPQGNQSFQSPAPAAPSYGAPAAYASSAPPTYSSPPPQQQQHHQTNYFAQPPPDQFVPVPQGQYSSGLDQWDDPFAPKPSLPPTRDDITKSILAGYGSTSSSQKQQMQPRQGSSLENGEAHANGNPYGAKLSMSGYAAQPEEKPLSDMEKAMKRLVNIDRIDEPAEEEYRLTMKKKEDSKKVKDGKSKGLPPAASGVVGSNATLSDISRVKGVSWSLILYVTFRRQFIVHRPHYYDFLFSTGYSENRRRCDATSTAQCFPPGCGQCWSLSCSWSRRTAPSKRFWCWIRGTAPKLSTVRSMVMNYSPTVVRDSGT